MPSKKVYQNYVFQNLFQMETIQKQMTRNKRIKRKMLVEWNAEKAFKKEEKLFDVEKKYKNQL